MFVYNPGWINYYLKTSNLFPGTLIKWNTEDGYEFNYTIVGIEKNDTTWVTCLVSSLPQIVLIVHQADTLEFMFSTFKHQVYQFS